MASEKAIAEINAAAVRYMGEQMAMTKPWEDQEQNWILGHMVTFVAGLVDAAREEGRRAGLDIALGWIAIEMQARIEDLRKHAASTPDKEGA